LHFAPTQGAVNNLAKESITENVYLTGNTVIDALLDTVKRLPEATINHDLYGKADFNNKRVVLVTAHRRENWGSGMDEIALALRQIADEFEDIQILYPIHKNPVVRESIEPVFAGHPRLILVEPLDYVPFVYAQQHCHLILTDSGGVQEEAPTLGKPVLVMRTNTERPEAVEAGAARLVGVNKESIVKHARELLTSQKAYGSMANAMNPYGDGQAAPRIVRAIEEYLGVKSVVKPAR
jgi:UDP-N-acetylglucosamine 2-epimerase (non-hydrolysing)